MNAEQALVRARTLADAGQVELAKDTLQSSLSSDGPNPSERVDALVALADLQAATDEPAAAGANLREALDLLGPHPDGGVASSQYIRAVSLLSELDDDEERDDPIEFDA